MNPEAQSYNLLGVTRSKAKMFEYGVLEEFHLQLYKNPMKLFTLCIGIVGDYNIDNEDSKNAKLTAVNRDKLLFAAQFFDSFIGSKLDSDHKDYFSLVASVAYYLVDLPGSSTVLSRQISDGYNFEAQGLEILLIWLLQNDFNKIVDFSKSEYSAECNNLYQKMREFVSGIDNEVQINEALTKLRANIYENGSDRELLFIDMVAAIFRKRLYNSTRNSLRRYSSLDIKLWNDIILKPTFVKEFWPSQQFLGEKEIFNGKSGVIQMPTSSGKTKSIELIIRSSFLSGRSQTAVIIAPFRALCSEIKNSLQIAFKFEPVIVDEPSDVMQPDFFSEEDFDGSTVKRILILTPEKLIYILRTSPEISNDIGLLIYDEGHQFDNGIRGVTYELLLSSLKNKVSASAQIVLISAVISNADAIGNWLIEGEKEIISDKNLLPTYRTIAFASWKTALGQLMFIKNTDPDSDEYYVPRVLETTTLQLKNRETAVRNFPVKSSGNDISLYLSFKLVTNGSCAIFCGSKSTVKSLSKRIIEIVGRGYDISNILSNSDKEEVSKLSYLHKKHFGSSNIFSGCAELGVFSHSGITPEGIRLAIEYSLQSGKIKFIICTSTLAQGVNLPIRYLLISSFYQAQNRIKNRDFHNLIGRAGRSGIYTEGSIIFTDIDLYDKKDNWRTNWKWNQAKDLLDPNKSEPCSSTLLSIFDPLRSDDENFSVDISPIELVEMYLNSSSKLRDLPNDFYERHSDKNFSISGLSFQINYKIQIISALESYLMAYWQDYDIDTSIANVDVIAKETLAYTLAGETQKKQLIALFEILAENIKVKTTARKRQLYGRTLLGLEQLLKLEIWTLQNLEMLAVKSSPSDLLDCIWPVLYEMSNESLKKITPEENAHLLTKSWIDGNTYEEILIRQLANDSKIIANTQLRVLDQEMVVDICQNNFSFGVTLTVGAICEVINIHSGHLYSELINNLYLLQKVIKYGLPNQLAIAFYELGFADRVIALELAESFASFPLGRLDLTNAIIDHEADVRAVLDKYPSYFEGILDEML